MPSAGTGAAKTVSASKPKRASSSPATAPKAKNAAPQRRRSPLSDLNSDDASDARHGCFRFLLSSANGSRSRCASTPRTPASDPKPRPWIERRGTGGGRLADQESRTRPGEWSGKDLRNRRREGVGGRTKRLELANKQGSTARVQVEALTPERKADARATPSSGATPPIHASISPEVVACGSATPVCFAAGHHVVPGVGDRRKCRPRGILAIAGEEAVSEELEAEPSQASIYWLSSPSVEAATCSTKCGNEASVNWLVSPLDEVVVDLLDDEIFVPRCSSEDAFWRFSPDCTGLLGSPLLGGVLDFGTPLSEVSETTPSSGFLPVQKTPSTGDSISPFSLIVKRASESSRLSSLCAQQGLGSYRYGSVADRTPISGKSWGENSSQATSGLTRTGSRPVTKMDTVVECLEMMSLSPRPGDADYVENGALPTPLPELTFQFAGAPTPLESIDLSCFKRFPCESDLKGKDVNLRKPVSAEARISWREGLVSRMFDMGDLHCCKWLSDDEDEPVLEGGDKALLDSVFQPTTGPCLQQGDDQPAAGGFGSVEFSCTGGELKEDSKPPQSNLSAAESMRAEGFELVSSDDSDWTLFYKNDLFER